MPGFMLAPMCDASRTDHRRGPLAFGRACRFGSATAAVHTAADCDAADELERQWAELVVGRFGRRVVVGVLAVADQLLIDQYEVLAAIAGDQDGGHIAG